MMDAIPFLMFATVCLVLLAGYPVAFSLAGTALLFAGAGSLFGVFDLSLMNALPSRLFGVITNQTLIAVPLFVFMGVMLEKSKVAESLLESMARLFGKTRGGAWPFGHRCWHAAGCQYRDCWSHSRHHGTVISADHAASGIFPRAGDRDYLCNGQPWADHSSLHSPGSAGRCLIQCIPAVTD